MTDTNAAKEIDWEHGVPVADIPDGETLSGTFDGNEVLLVHKGGEFFAIGAHCTH